MRRGESGEELGPRRLGAGAERDGEVRAWVGCSELPDGSGLEEEEGAGGLGGSGLVETAACRVATRKRGGVKAASQASRWTMGEPAPGPWVSS